jgi:prepilin-type N-terminal cleavage/methylation domain-containing protein
MRGTTLIELLVVLFILGFVAGVSAFAVMGFHRPVGTERAETLGHAHAQAIRSGRPVTVAADSQTTIRFLPDGRAIGLGVDPFTGELVHAVH